ACKIPTYYSPHITTHTQQLRHPHRYLYTVLAANVNDSIILADVQCTGKIMPTSYSISTATQ
uniref:Uncharacterized protein n=1 Tax=Oryza brachyantha TaxID=4533 RepID=J3MPX6_ORYBR